MSLWDKSEANLRNLERARAILVSSKESCKFCGRFIQKGNIVRHIKSCPKNPVNEKQCPVCDKPLSAVWKTYCSQKCANRGTAKFGEEHRNWTGTNYAKRCFDKWGKACVVCGELVAVHAHHIDKNRKNNSLNNLMPLCANHHYYIHSEHFYLIKEQIEKYLSGRGQ